LNRGKVANIILPFIIGILISYILNPIVTFLVSKGMKRSIAVSLIYFVLLGSLVVALVYIIPIIIMELDKLIDTIPFYTKEAQRIFSAFKTKYKSALPLGVQEVVDNNIHEMEKLILDVLQNITDILVKGFSGLFSFILGPILGFYILKDLDIIKKSLTYYLPYKYRDKIISFARKIDSTMGRYIRSQIIVSFIVGLLTTLAMYLLKIDFSILIGLLSAITNIIPYFGPIIGMIPALMIAILKYPEKIVWIIISVIIINQLESSIISPHIMGENVGIHPLTVIFSLLIGGNFFGFWGLVFAVPIAALIKLLITPLVEQWQKN